MRFISFYSIVIGLLQSNTAIGQSMEPPADPPLDEVKYFVSSPPPPGLNFGYHTAAISGELNIKDGCLRIGNISLLWITNLLSVKTTKAFI